MKQAFLDHVNATRYLGTLPAPDGHARLQGACGDAVEFFLYVRDGRITHATYLPHGCAATKACGSALADLVQGLGLEQALDLESQRLDEALGGLPADHAHCAELAVAGLREAVRDHFARCRRGWKGIYEPA
jgi:NifU-like protein involved in Fe-S cluster formation